MKWIEDALCRQVGGDFWTVDEGEGQTRATNAAVRVCLRCPVQAECLQYALTRPERYGVWGGTTQTARQKLLRKQGRIA